MSGPWLSRNRPHPLLLVLGALLLAPLATAFAASKLPPPPDILSTAPAVLKRGQTYDLVPQFTTTTMDFWTVRQLEFGTGITATRKPDTPVRTWVLVVSPQAPLGRHDITITYGKAGADLSYTRIATAFVTVTGGDAPPDVVAIAPAALQQGQEATLLLTTKHFTAVPQLSFGAGVAVVGRPQFRNDDREHPTLKVAVAADAPTGRHDITIENAPRRRIASAFLTVLPAAPAPPVAIESATPPPVAKAQPGPVAFAGLDVLAASPNVWRAGSTYDLKLTGRGFAPGLQLRFAAGVTVAGEPQVISPSQARVTVAVAKDAALGVRRVEAAAAKGQDFSSTSATVRVTFGIAAAKRTKAEVVPLYESVLVVPTIDTIALIDPAPYDESTASGPVFNDQTTFRWQEQNPGLSEEFELRIVYRSKSGVESPLVSARIRPHQGASLPPTFYSPEPALWDQLLTGTFDLVEDKDTLFQDAEHPDQEPSSTYTYSGKLGTRTMYWQVRGYRVFSKVTYAPTAGNQPGQKGAKQVEKSQLLVAESELRPLRHPSQPLGLWCFSEQNTQTPEGNRDSHDLKLQNLEADSIVNYTNDRIELSGTIEFGDLPYQMKGAAGPEPDGGESATYYNVFVDWGDGSGAEPLSSYSPPPPDYSSYTPPASSAAVSGALHRYAKAGTHVVRVFMLSAADAWFNDPSALSAAVDAANPDSAIPWYDDPEQFAGSSTMDVARRAYLLYCSSITVVPRKDLVAEGPLLLESLEITGFNGEGARPASLGDALIVPPGAVQLQAGKLAPGAVPSAAKARGEAEFHEALSGQEQYLGGEKG